MEKLYYTLDEATKHLNMDAVNLGERGKLPMAYRWPEKSNTQNTYIAIKSHINPGYMPVAFGYITPADFSRVVNATRKGDKAHLLNTFATLEELENADEIITRRKSGVHLVVREMVNAGVKYDATFAGLDDIYVTADAMVKYETADDVEERAPVADGPDHDEKLAALFDPVPVEALEKMFPADDQWRSWAERAARTGLKAARIGRGMFNPYKAGVWFVRNGRKGWDDARLNRTLSNNLPPRSRDESHLLTGGID